MIAAFAGFVVVAVVPVSGAGGTATLATLLGLFLPALAFALLAALWLLRGLAGATA